MAQPQLLAFAAVPAGLLFSTVFYASLYFTVTDCFAVDAAPTAGPGEQRLTRRCAHGARACACWSSAPAPRPRCTPARRSPARAATRRRRRPPAPTRSTGPRCATTCAANASLALGVTTSFTPSYAGSSERKVTPHLVWAFQYGRIRLSTGGGAAVLGIAQDPRGPGASAELFSTNRLRAGVAFRIDRGRDSSAIDGLEDLPDVDATVRGRAYASYALTPHWTVAGAVSPDLLGRGGGTVGDARRRLSRAAHAGQRVVRGRPASTWPTPPT